MKFYKIVMCYLRITTVIVLYNGVEIKITKKTDIYPSVFNETKYEGRTESHEQQFFVK